MSLPNNEPAPSLAEFLTARLDEDERKRRIIEQHYDAGGVCGKCGPKCGECDPEPYPCDRLKLLALPYADHPDYQPEWAA